MMNKQSVYVCPGCSNEVKDRPAIGRKGCPECNSLMIEKKKGVITK